MNMDMHFGLESSSGETKFSTFPSLSESQASDLDLPSLRILPPEEFAKFATFQQPGLMSPSELDIGGMSISGHHPAAGRSPSSSPSLSSAVALAHQLHSSLHRGSSMSASNGLTSPHISTSASLSSALHGHHHHHAMSAAAVSNALSAATGGIVPVLPSPLHGMPGGGHNPLTHPVAPNSAGIVDSSMVPSLDFNLPRMRAMSNPPPHPYYLRGGRRRAVSEADQSTVKSALRSNTTSPHFGRNSTSPRAPGSSHSSTQSSPQHASRGGSLSPHSSNSTPTPTNRGATTNGNGTAYLFPSYQTGASSAANGSRSHPNSPPPHARSPHASPPLQHRSLSVNTSHRSVASMTRASGYGGAGGSARGAVSPSSSGGGRRRAKSKGDSMSPQVLKKSRKRVPVACVPCNKAKTSCSGSRPCHRCLTRRHPEQCIDVVHRKKGRPKKVKDANSGHCLSPLGSPTASPAGAVSPVHTARSATNALTQGGSLAGQPPMPYLHLPPPPGSKYVAPMPHTSFGTLPNGWAQFGALGTCGAQFNMSMPAAGSGMSMSTGANRSAAHNARAVRFKFELNAEMSDLQPGATMSGSVSLQPLSTGFMNGHSQSSMAQNMARSTIPPPLPLAAKAPSPVIASPSNANLPKSKVYFDTWQKAWDNDTLRQLLKESKDRAVPAKVCFAYSLLSASLLIQTDKDQLRHLVTDNLKSMGFDMSSPLPVHEVDYELDPAPSKVSQFPALNLRYSVTDSNRIRVCFSSSSFDQSFHYKREDFVALRDASVKVLENTKQAVSEKGVKEEEVHSTTPFWWRCLLNKDTDLIVLMEQRALAGRMTNDGCVVNLMLKTGSVVKCAANISCNEQILPKSERFATAAAASQESTAVKMEDENTTTNSNEGNPSSSSTFKFENGVKSESSNGVYFNTPPRNARNLAGFAASLSYAFVPIPQSVKAEPSVMSAAASAATALDKQQQAASILGLAHWSARPGATAPAMNLPPPTSPHGLPSFFPHMTQPLVFPQVPTLPQPQVRTHAPTPGLVNFGQHTQNFSHASMSDIPDPTTNHVLLGSAAGTRPFFKHERRNM